MENSGSLPKWPQGQAHILAFQYAGTNFNYYGRDFIFKLLEIERAKTEINMMRHYNLATPETIEELMLGLNELNKQLKEFE